MSHCLVNSEDKVNIIRAKSPFIVLEPLPNKSAVWPVRLLRSAIDRSRILTSVIRPKWARYCKNIIFKLLSCQTDHLGNLSRNRLTMCVDLSSEAECLELFLLAIQYLNWRFARGQAYSNPRHKSLQSKARSKT